MSILSFLQKFQPAPVVKTEPHVGEAMSYQQAKAQFAQLEAIRRPPQPPMAIILLQGFKQYAAVVDRFFAGNECEKAVMYVMGIQPLPVLPFASLGITPQWVNALDYDGLANGVPINQCGYDGAHMTIKGEAVTNPTLTWATVDGQPTPGYAPSVATGQTGADVLAAFLSQGAVPGSYLYSLGLTPEAIAAARV